MINLEEASDKNLPPVDDAQDKATPDSSPKSPPTLMKLRRRSQLPTSPTMNNKPNPPVSSRTRTPPRSNRTQPTNTHFELRVTFPASSPDDALKVIRDTLAKILAKIWDSDKKA